MGVIQDGNIPALQSGTVALVNGEASVSPVYLNAKSWIGLTPLTGGLTAPKVRAYTLFNPNVEPFGGYDKAFHLESTDSEDDRLFQWTIVTDLSDMKTSLEPEAVPLLPGTLVWLRGDSLVTVVAGKVTAWGSRTGIGDGTGSGGLFPDLLNSLEANAVRGDGIDGLVNGDVVAAIAQPCTVVSVAQFLADTNTHTLWDGDAINTMRLLDASSNYQMNAGSAGPEQPLDLLPHIFWCEYNGATSNFYLDGGNLQSGDVGAGDGGGYTLFANGSDLLFGNAKIAEYLVYDRIPTAAERAAVLAYLSNRYTIALV